MVHLSAVGAVAWDCTRSCGHRLRVLCHVHNICIIYVYIYIYILGGIVDHISLYIYVFIYVHM